jgi:hypothetical protein
MNSKILLLFCLLTFANGQSWLSFPFPRNQEEYLFTPEKLANNKQIWGCPENYSENIDEVFPKAIVNRGEELCVSWVSNGKTLDTQRGYISLYLSNNQTNLQDNLFENPLITEIDFNNFEGIKVQIPEKFPVGPAILQWRWFYCGENTMYVSCADIIISETEGTIYGIPEIYKGLTLGQCNENSTAFFVSGNQDLCPNQLNNPDYHYKENENNSRKNTNNNICQVEIDLDIGNPYIGAIDINDITYSNNCDAGTTAGRMDNQCSVKITLDFINEELHQVNLTNLIYNTDCGSEECIFNKLIIPEGYCLTDFDCIEESYCKNYKIKETNGYYICQ